MKTEPARRCNTCQGMDLVVTEERDTCKYCGSPAIEMVELPPRPSRKRHEEAYRARAGLVGELLSCVCTYPLDVDSATVSGHDARCPSELMARRRIEVEEARAAREQEVGGPMATFPVDDQPKYVDTMKVRAPAPEDDDRPPWER